MLDIVDLGRKIGSGFSRGEKKGGLVSFLLSAVGRHGFSQRNILSLSESEEHRVASTRSVEKSSQLKNLTRSFTLLVLKCINLESTGEPSLRLFQEASNAIISAAHTNSSAVLATLCSMATRMSLSANTGP